MSSYSRKLTDPRWQKKRLEILERDKWTCTVCKDSKLELHVHHEHYNGEPWEADSKFLKTVCFVCHSIITCLESKYDVGYKYIDCKKFSHEGMNGIWEYSIIYSVIPGTYSLAFGKIDPKKPKELRPEIKDGGWIMEKANWLRLNGDDDEYYRSGHVYYNKSYLGFRNDRLIAFKILYGLTDMENNIIELRDHKGELQINWKEAPSTTEMNVAEKIWNQLNETQLNHLVNGEEYAPNE